MKFQIIFLQIQSSKCLGTTKKFFKGGEIEKQMIALSFSIIQIKQLHVPSIGTKFKGKYGITSNAIK